MVSNTGLGSHLIYPESTTKDIFCKLASKTNFKGQCIFNIFFYLWCLMKPANYTWHFTLVGIIILCFMLSFCFISGRKIKDG